MGPITSRDVLVFCLLAATVLAGCTISSGEDTDDNETDTPDPQVSVTQDDGLTASFSSVSQVYVEGEDIVLELVLENTGERAASRIEKELFGASFIAQKAPYYSGDDTLDGVDRSRERRGEQTEVVWRIRNPVDLDPQDRETFSAGARVKYRYATTARGTFTIVPRREFDGNSAQIETRTSAGPLEVEIDVQSPKPLSSADSGNTYASIPIIVRNVGDGRVANIDGEAQPIEILRAEFPNADNAELDCTPSTFQLFDGEGRIVCSAELPSDVFRQQLTLRIDLLYDYFEIVEDDFQVEGLAGDQSR